MTDLYSVRIVFEFDGQKLHEFVGPLDRYLAELVCVDFAAAPYQYGPDAVRVERARVVPAEAAS